MFAAVAMVGCDDGDSDDPLGLTPVESWETEFVDEFGDRFEGEALFGFINDVRPSADGSRVHVLDGMASEVTIWSPDGTLVRRLGRSGQGPGEFLEPEDLVLMDDRFYVADQRRFTTFTLDGEVMATDAPPASVSWRGFRFLNEGMFADGSFVVFPQVPAMIVSGATGDDPVDRIPLLRISRDGDAWGLDTLAIISYEGFAVPFSVPGYPLPRDIALPWYRPDSYQVDARSGTVVVARSHSVGPGVAELIEISATGDTVWTRRIRMPPVPIEDQEVDAVVEQNASGLARLSGDSVASPILKARVRSALRVPEYWPSIRAIRIMANGEVWFRPHHGEGEPAWYAVRRGETRGPMRRIVLPESFGVADVTDTHVWGVRYDELGVQFVAHRRLARVGE